MLILGLKDTVVTPGQIRALAQTLRDRRGVVRIASDFSHPFQELDPFIRRRRWQIVGDFLLSR